MNEIAPAPTRDQARSAGAVFDSMYARWQQAERDLEAVRAECGTLRARLHTALKQIDDRDQRIHELEQFDHLNVVGREGVLNHVETAYDAIGRARTGIHNLAMDDAAMRRGEKSIPDPGDFAPHPTADPVMDPVEQMEADLHELIRSEHPGHEDAEPIPEFLSRPRERR